MRLALDGGQNNCYPHFSGQVRLAQDKCTVENRLLSLKPASCTAVQHKFQSLGKKLTIRKREKQNWLQHQQRIIKELKGYITFLQGNGI
jgi:hypothetical protein